jgi:hypothetical protein
MRANAALTALAVAVLVFTFAAVPWASAAPSDDACALVTQAQVSAAVGVSMGAGTHVTPTFVKTCTWSPSPASKDVSAVTVSYQDAASFGAAKGLMQQSQAMANQKGNNLAESASGIGDDAFYSSMGTGYTALLFKKGNVALKIAIYGQMPADKKKAAAKTLALNALSKL